MKIHVVTQTFPPRIGGMQTLMYSLSEGLSQKKYDVGDDSFLKMKQHLNRIYKKSNNN